MIAFTAIAMGMRNAAVRKLAVPDMTTTVLTLTITGITADSSLAGTQSPFAAAICSGGGDVCWCSVRLDNPETLLLHCSRFFRRAVVTLQPRVADIVPVALRKKRRKGLTRRARFSCVRFSQLLLRNSCRPRSSSMKALWVPGLGIQLAAEATCCH
jgi:hypothetical protein